MTEYSHRASRAFKRCMFQNTNPQNPKGTAETLPMQETEGALTQI